MDATVTQLVRHRNKIFLKSIVCIVVGLVTLVYNAGYGIGYGRTPIETTVFGLIMVGCTFGTLFYYKKLTIVDSELLPARLAHHTSEDIKKEITEGWGAKPQNFAFDLVIICCIGMMYAVGCVMFAKPFFEPTTYNAVVDLVVYAVCAVLLIAIRSKMQDTCKQLQEVVLSTNEAASQSKV